MNQNINLCTTCKEYYEFKENLCSNCYNFKINGKHSMSRPCAECTAKINRFCRRARVFYTNYDGNLVEDVDMNNCHKSVRRTGRFKMCQECC